MPMDTKPIEALRDALVTEAKEAETKFERMVALINAAQDCDALIRKLRDITPGSFNWGAVR